MGDDQAGRGPHRDEGLLDYADAATFLKFTERHVERMVQRGQLPHLKFGRSVRFRRSDLEAFIEARLVPARKGS